MRPATSFREPQPVALHGPPLFRRPMPPTGSRPTTLPDRSAARESPSPADGSPSQRRRRDGLRSTPARFACGSTAAVTGRGLADSLAHGGEYTPRLAVFPMYIAWGPEYTKIYNDGYRPTGGRRSTRRPRPGRASETFAESWHIIGSDVRPGSWPARRWAPKTTGTSPLDRHGLSSQGSATSPFPIAPFARSVAPWAACTSPSPRPPRACSTSDGYAPCATWRRGGGRRQDRGTAWKRAAESAGHERTATSRFALLFANGEEGPHLAASTAGPELIEPGPHPRAGWRNGPGPSTTLLPSEGAPVLIDDILSKLAFSGWWDSKWPEPGLARPGCLPFSRPGTATAAYGVRSWSA